MYENIGKKLKSLAVVIAWIGIIASFIIGVVLFAINKYLIPVAIIVITVGTIVAWLSNLSLYGFGELVEKTTETAQYLAEIAKSTKESPAPVMTQNSEERKAMLRQMYREGLIELEEYTEKLGESDH